MRSKLDKRCFIHAFPRGLSHVVFDLGAQFVQSASFFDGDLVVRHPAQNMIGIEVDRWDAQNAALDLLDDPRTRAAAWSDARMRANVVLGLGVDV